LRQCSKELLQSSLRPILVNLAHYKNLTMPLLVGLERLLELLSNWFNPTLGEKLLEHLRRWLEPDKQVAGQAAGQQAQARPPPKDCKIAAAMINLFHLLPQAAGKFLEPLVMLTIQLEVALPPTGVHSEVRVASPARCWECMLSSRIGTFVSWVKWHPMTWRAMSAGPNSEVNSLYRKPLAKFLSRYAADTVDYFLARLAQPQFFFRLLDMIRMKEGENLRKELAKSAQKIILAAFTWPRPGGGSGGGGAEAEVQAAEGLSGIGGGSDLAAYNGLKLITVMVKHMPEWLHTQPELQEVLWRRWRSDARALRLRSEEMLALPELLESKRLAKCFINVASRDRTQVSCLFDILSIFGTRTRVDFTFVEGFYTAEVAEKYTPEERNAVLMHFLACFKNRSLSPPELVSALNLIVLPMLEFTLKEVSTDAVKMEEAKLVVTEKAVRSIVVDLLETADDEASPAHSEPLRIQLLRMGTLLIRNLPDELVRHRKELIKFGWNHLKSEDSGSKQWAFVNVCHFLEAYQAPEKIVLQVFVALLRACQPEAKELVRQALGALTPALPKRLPQGDHKYPIWIRYTKKILVEEGHSLPHLIHVWNLIVQHETHFYPSRAQFVPQMVNSLSRLGLPSSSPPENRVLSISLVELILEWEAQRKTRRAAAGEAMDAAKETPVDVGAKRGRGDDADADAGAGAKKGKGVDGKAVPMDTKEEDKDEDKEEDKEKDAAAATDKDLLPGSAEKGVAEAGEIASADDLAGAMDDDKAGGGKSDKAEAAPVVPAPADADEFKPSPAMEEIIVNFLVRMAFLTGESKVRRCSEAPGSPRLLSLLQPKL
jgi:transformation/transcription domain-associated protein